jgi:hypothetical protein
MIHGPSNVKDGIVWSDCEEDDTEFEV